MHKASRVHTRSREETYAKGLCCRQPTLTQASVVDSTARTQGLWVRWRQLYRCSKVLLHAAQRQLLNINCGKAFMQEILNEIATHALKRKTYCNWNTIIIKDTQMVPL